MAQVEGRCEGDVTQTGEHVAMTCHDDSCADAVGAALNMGACLALATTAQPAYPSHR